MSYCILYNRCFVKIPVEAQAAVAGTVAARIFAQETGKVVSLFPEALYLPLIEIGASNCYQGNRRARSWQRALFLPQDRMFLNQAEILAAIDAEDRSLREHHPDYTPKQFAHFAAITLEGRGKFGTTFGMYRGFFENGIKEAGTIEELSEYGVQVSLRLPWNTDSIEAAGLEIRPNRILRSTNELIEQYADWRSYYGTFAGGLRFQVYGDSGLEIMRREQTKKKLEQQRTRAAEPEKPRRAA